MNNVKVKVSLSFVMLLVFVMAFSSAFAVNRIFNLTAKYNGTEITDGQTINYVKGVNKIEISTNPTYVDNTLAIGYAWDSAAVTVAAKGTKTATIEIPSYTAGSTHKLSLEALIKDNAHSYVGNSNVVNVSFVFPKSETTNIEVDLKQNGSTVSNGSTIEAKVKDTLTAVATSNKTVDMIAYCWDNGSRKTSTGSNASIVVPSFEVGSTHKLDIQAVTTEDIYSSPKSYTVKITGAAEETKVSMVIKSNNSTLSNGSNGELKVGDKVTVTGTATNGKNVAIIAYCWDNGKLTKVNGSTATITVPSNFEAGSTHILSIQACSEDNKYSEAFNYTVKIPAADPATETKVSLVVKVGNTTLSNGGNGEMKAGETVVATGSATNNKKVAIVAYCWDDGVLTKVNSSSATITVPTSFTTGSTHKLSVQACSEDNKYSEAFNYTIKVTSGSTSVEDTKVTLTVKAGNTTLSNGGNSEMKVGDNVVASAVTNNSKKVIIVAYCWDDGALTKVNGSTATIAVPSNFTLGSSHKLSVQACSEDDKYSAAFNYTVKVSTSSTISSTVTVNIKDGTSVLANNAEVELEVGDKLTVVGSATNNQTVTAVSYKWDNETATKVNASTATVTVPSDFKVGSTHKLTAQAYSNDIVSDAKTVTVYVVASTPTSDDLDIEDWMKENKELDSLAVSLRNDSDSDKGNKNFYALKEEAIYYVDYKNGGKDINSEVKLVLELPLEFKVIDSYGGKVDKSKKTITWTFPDGLEEDQAGTKIVRIAYTALDSKNKKYKIVYPVAKIYKASKVSDKSAVINYIYKDEDTVINDEHYPYMFGDKNQTTFRPDDGISRAEGALVLTRILGINTSGTVVNSEYTDLNETYLEAQKAIVAATKLGIINGYPDKTYRPNKKMTKAEFMKIIASYIEIDAEDDKIDGLEIKDENKLIKIYKNPTSVYVMGGSTTSTHWALNWVTLLTRLNMTPVSSSNRNLNLDDDITRAEVTQLVNFYLFRAPADNGKSLFSDVSKNHKLFKDIVEATKPAHTYTITEDGYEEAEKESN